MMKWYAHSSAATSSRTGDTFAVTGYKPRRHLAAGFNQVMVDRGQGARIASTYTFNGAGVGTVNAGHTLDEILQTFKAERDADNGSLFKTHDCARHVCQIARSDQWGREQDTLARALSDLVLAKSDPLLNSDTRAELSCYLCGVSQQGGVG